MSIRPLCPDCDLEMLYVAIFVDGQVLSAWMCDCADQPYFLKHEIDVARSLEHMPEAALAIDLDGDRQST